MATIARHPLAMAAQALAAQAATGKPVDAGAGPEPPEVVAEGRLGLAWDRPLLRVREYLDVLQPVLRGVRGAGSRRNDRCHRQACWHPVPVSRAVLLAAHGPQMLALAGARTDGVITLWARPRHIADFIVPAVTADASGLGRGSSSA